MIAPAYYDSPSNNSSIKNTPTYCYARKESMYSVVQPKSRKGSLDSHLYDEIPYPTARKYSQNSNPYVSSAFLGQQQQPTQHVSHLVIPAQNSNFLQVPQIMHTTRKVAHL